MPFVKGDERINREGRPVGSKGLNLTSLLKDKLQEIPEGKKETYSELFIKTLLHKAMIEKDLQSLKLIMNYVDGLPKQSMDITSKGKEIAIGGFNYIKSNDKNNTNNSAAPEARQSLD